MGNIGLVVAGVSLAVAAWWAIWGWEALGKLSRVPMLRVRYLSKYAAYGMAVSTFVNFLVAYTGRGFNLDKWLFLAVGAAPTAILVLRYFGVLPKRFGDWLGQVPGREG